MRRQLTLCLTLVAGSLAVAALGPVSLAAPPSGAGGLRPVSAFNGIADPAQRSLALFQEAGKVITHPRCMNCHPKDDRPTQGEAMTPHQPWVVRGADGHGAPGLNCETCHQSANYEVSGVPGNPKWHLAPAEMAWQGKTLGQICELIKDPKRNGGMDRAKIVHHMSEDELVGWGWAPGGGRKPAPGTQKQFGQLIAAWLETGGKCPT